MLSSQTTPGFPLLSPKHDQVDFASGRLPSDGGLLLLTQLDRTAGGERAIHRKPSWMYRARFGCVWPAAAADTQTPRRPGHDAQAVRRGASCAG